MTEPANVTPAMRWAAAMYVGLLGGFIVGLGIALAIALLRGVLTIGTRAGAIDSATGILLLILVAATARFRK